MPISIMLSEAENNEYCVYFGNNMIDLEHYKKAKRALDNLLSNKKLLAQIKYNNIKQVKSNNTRPIHVDDTSGYIYIILVNEYYKIGRTKNYNTRRKTYITENPTPIQTILFKHVNNHIQIEKKLHNMFKHKLHQSEWFKLNASDINKIKKYLKKYEI